MKTHIRDFPKATLVRAVQMALLALCATPGLALAEDEGDVKPLLCPTNYFEIGALSVSDSSTKFGEYSGLNKSGVYAMANFAVSGGDGYCKEGGALRWQVAGKDLGTNSRSLAASVAEQGKWKVGVSFDQMRHYTTNGFQTPFLGSQGDNVFVLPANFGMINVAQPVTPGIGNPGVASITGTNSLTAAQLAAMHTRNVYTERRNSNIDAAYSFNDEWSVAFKFERIDQSGAKLISSASNAFTNYGGGGRYYSNEGIVMLMNPKEQKTDQFTLTLSWVGENAFADLEYYGSFYSDDNRGLSWTSPYTNTPPAASALPPGVTIGTAGTTGTLPGAAGLPLNTMSTPPDNSLHQFKFAGGYTFSQQTKLVGGLSYSVNKQDQSFSGSYTPAAILPGTTLPFSSLDGKVVNTHADLRLTHQFMPSLNLNVGFKYNERDNQTDAGVFSFYNVNQPITGMTPLTNVVNATTAPMSYKKEQFDASLTYRIDKKQRVDVGYEYEQVKRWCNDSLSNNAVGQRGAAWNGSGSCAQVPKSEENRFNLGYKLAILDTVSFNAGYTYADRDATLNSTFYNPVNASTANGYENWGYLAAFQGSRRQNMLKSGVNWQVSHEFDVGLNVRHTKDDYYDTDLGVQSGKSSGADLYANFNPSEYFSYGAWASWQKQSRDMESTSVRSGGLGIAPPGIPATGYAYWGNRLDDKDEAIGLFGKQKLMHGKLQFSEDLSYSVSKSNYNTTLGAGSVAATTGNYGSPGDIKSRLTQARLSATYLLDKTSSITGGYLYQKLRSNDYYYNAYQYGYTPNAMLPTNQQDPSYHVDVVYVAYRYSFQ